MRKTINKMEKTDPNNKSVFANHQTTRKYKCLLLPWLNLLIEFVYLWILSGPITNFLKELAPQGAQYFGIEILIFFLILHLLVMVPILSFKYYQNIIRYGNKKYLYCVYNALIMALGVTLCGCPYKNFVFFIASITTPHWQLTFWLSLILGIITMVIYSRKNDNVPSAQADNESPAR